MATLDLGKIKQVWRGTYNNGTAYVVDDLVEYTDTGITSTYICVANSTGNAPSSGGSAHASWNYVAKGTADVIPSQSGNSGKFLTSNGSAASWGTVASVGQAHNLVINGAMQVAQRGTSSTGTGYTCVDKFAMDFSNTDENPTVLQADVASGTAPYNLGFRKSFQIYNGNQTNGAGTTDQVNMYHRIEAQNIANSGWNYTDSNSKLTISFWAKASVAQTYQFVLYSYDGTAQGYASEFALSANTWTKITKTIPGNSNLTFNNDNGAGLELLWYQFIGTNNTLASPTMDAWGAWNSSTTRKDMTSTWYTTNDATFEITGVQAEIGDTANDFAHESYADALAKCQRYFISTNQAVWNNVVYATHYFPTTMRANPTIVSSSSGADQSRLNCWYGKHNSGGINGGVSFNWTASAEI